MIEVLNAGLQTTIQAGVRAGHRHFGVPGSGPADPLSMSLANRLVGADATQPAFEITLTGASFCFHSSMMVSVTGAEAGVSLNGVEAPLHATVLVSAGDVLEVAPARHGCRSYLAVSGRLDPSEFLGSRSTYLPGGFGGHEGRAVKAGDRIEVSDLRSVAEIETPRELRPLFNDNVLLQGCPSSEFEFLNEDAQTILFEEGLKATQRSSRMGVELSGDRAVSCNAPQKQSSPVFPGSVQCPPEGKPFILLADAQTTGGYPHILQVIRSDRFQLGQIKPGARVRFILRTPDEAADRFRARWDAYSDWLSSPVI